MRVGTALTIVLVLLCGEALPILAADACHLAADSPDVRAALAEIARGIDPCGETSTVAQLLREFERCSQRSYPICINRESDRNSIDRSNDERGEHVVITWNPDLRTELEVGCDGDPARPVLRDPMASLLHEVAHAVQDCSGLDPNEHELEAVRIENIYRRAHGLCQRTAYGTHALPPEMLLACEPRSCLCAPQRQRALAVNNPARMDPEAIVAGDAATP